MNPAFDRIVSLLVEISDRPPAMPPRPTSTNRGLVGGFPTSTVRKPTKRSKRFDPEAEDVKKKMLGGAKPSYSVSTDQQEQPQDSKKGSFFKKMLGAFMRKFGRNKPK